MRPAAFANMVAIPPKTPKKGAMSTDALEWFKTESTADCFAVSSR